MLAPAAERVAEEFIQTAADVAVTLGKGFTDTVQVVCAVQVPTVPVIVYTEVVLGFAVTKLPEVALKPLAGSQA